MSRFGCEGFLSVTFGVCVGEVGFKGKRGIRAEDYYNFAIFEH